MSTVEEIEAAILRLSERELAELRVWFADLDAARWDRQFEEEVRAGRLDALAEEAIADNRAGRCEEL